MKNFKISTKLVILVSLLTLIILFIGTYGLTSLKSNHHEIEILFNNRVNPLKLLKVISDEFSISIVDASNKADNNLISFKKANKEVDLAISNLKKEWEEFASVPHDADEESIVREIETHINDALISLEILDEILEVDDSLHRNQLDEFIIKELYTIVDPITEKINELILIQLQKSEETYVGSEELYNDTLLYSASLMIISILFALSFSVLIIKSISRNTKLVTEYTEKLSLGDFSVSEAKENFKDELGIILSSIKTVGLILTNLKLEMNHMSEEHIAGDIDVKIESSKFEGDFKTMANGINEMVFGHISVKKKAMACFAEIGRGFFDAEIEKFPGKKVFINETIEEVRLNLKSTLNQLNKLIIASKEGQLKTRADADMFQGDWKVLVQGVNAMLDAILLPIQEGNRVLQLISKGDLKQRVELELHGEHQDMKNAVNAVQVWLNKMVTLIKEISEGNLTVKLKKLSDADELSETLINMVASLNSIVGEVMQASEQIKTGSNEISVSASQVAQGANEQASSTEEVSASIEEMLATIEQNTENAVQTNRIALKASEDIAEGQKSFEITLKAMKEIAEKIHMISDIAEKTDLLAINAAVEAARAGEHGQGFAVVASEIRKLAETSQKAANEINKVSKSSLNIAEDSVKLLSEIVPNVKKTAQLVQEITATSTEQRSGASQINKAVQQLTQVTQQNTAASEEMASSSEELARQSEQLKEVVSFFNTGKSYTSKNLKFHKNTTNSLQNKSKDIGVDINLNEDLLSDSDFENF